jgi:NADPH:quinone reductase-like Zn-dependent oxidoreductase
MTLRARPAESDATLPDGSTVHVRVGIPEDSYIPQRELDTVTVELFANGAHVAAVTTVLDADQESEAHALLREIVSGLESGKLTPTAGAIEPLADSLR